MEARATSAEITESGIYYNIYIYIYICICIHIYILHLEGGYNTGL